MANKNKVLFLLSTDSLSSYGLDLAFEVAKEAGYDGLDLALWKNFDAWNVNYVKKLVKKHDLPIKVIQVSDRVNTKELNQALDLAAAVGADTIAFTAPTVFNYRTFNFIVESLPQLRDDNKDIKFTIINPEDSSLFALPIPKYRFANVVDIIKKFGCFLGLDVANIDEDALENDFMRKIQQFVPYISVVYFSDKSRQGKTHILPGDGILKLPSFLQKLKQGGYDRYFSSKIQIDKRDLADTEKVVMLFKNARAYFKEHFEDISEE